LIGRLAVWGHRPPASPGPGSNPFEPSLTPPKKPFQFPASRNASDVGKFGVNAGPGMKALDETLKKFEKK
jgi:hypothetical protein